MENIEEAAAAFFNEGFNCAESTLLALADYAKIESNLIPKLASGFGGGLGRYGETCGAVTGAVMAIGAVHGRAKTEGSNQEAKEKIYSLVQIFLNKFKKKYGSLKCIDLSGCNMLTPEGLEKFKNENVHANICSGLVMFAVSEALKLL